MKKISLGGVVGRTLAGTSGLSHVHLPEGVGVGIAEEVVQSANLARRSTPPFALLVTADNESLEDVTCPRVTAQQTIQYRQGDHVAVVYGRQPDLSSFIQVFREIFGQSFPEQAEGPVSLERLAQQIVHDILEALGVETLGNPQKQNCVEIVFSCLRILTTIHSRSVDTGRSWNEVWFAHVDAGLTNLLSMLDHLAGVESDLELSLALKKYGYAAFGLPKPVPGAKSYVLSESAAARLTDALSESWSDEDVFTVSAGQLATRPEVRQAGGYHALQDFDIENFDRAVAQQGNAWLGLVHIIGKNPDQIDRFSALTESQFKSPARNDEYAATMRVCLADGESLVLEPSLPESPFLVPLSSAGPVGGRQLQSEMLSIKIPTIQRIASGAVASSELLIEVSPASVAAWDGCLEVTEAGELVATGRLVKSIGTGANAATPFRQISLTVSFKANDPLALSVRPDISSKGYVFSDRRTFLVAAPYKRSGALGKISYFGPKGWGQNSSGDDDDREFAAELPKVSHGYQAILWHPLTDSDEKPLLDGVSMEPHQVLDELFPLRFTPTGENEFVVDESTFRVRPVAAGGGHQSALLAAAVKQQVVPDRPRPATESSIRGQAEAFYGRQLVAGNPAITNALGHIMMPSNDPFPIRDVDPQDAGAVLMPEAARRALGQVSYFKLDQEFVWGVEAERFRNAIRNLELGNRLRRQDVRGEGVDFEWPSRSSWRSLWGSSVLEEYLESYKELIAAARLTNRDENIFWATYPMSVSVWDVRGDEGCQAVLLSPLHPIRLSWLAGAEDVLFEAQNAVQHAGSLEGWNLPLVGPGESRYGRMLAVPTDSGEDQIFLGWSMMLPPGLSKPKRLAAPGRIGNSVTPGTAVSGLNATAVDAALRSFRKMHPHITTLTVDLHARDGQIRLGEIDDSVLTVAEEWGTDSSGRLMGGVRVLDSVRREGPAPRDAVTRLVRENRDMLLTWSRYVPRPDSIVSCNIRFLQDSGTTVRVSTGGESLGVVGMIPLRRFEGSPGSLTENHLSSSEPAVPAEMGWTPLTKALQACEIGESSPIVEAGMMRRDVGDVSADWTVMGESFLSPAIMAELMDDHGQGVRMLWEWRPPVFERSRDIPFMERRPFVTIAKIPDSFGHQLETLLIKAKGTSDVSDLKRTVMSSLGSRGVGLSSLLAMGGTHVAGALGFFLTFALFDNAISTAANRFVLPIDAADYFLRTLSGQGNHGTHQRRADVLFLEMDDDNIVLSPVEIKCYGLQSNSQGATLPGQDSSRFDESLEQLEASVKLLKGIEAQAAEVSEADRALWFNSFATLVETAARLSPNLMGSRLAFASRLSALVDGHMRISVGNPLLVYLQHGVTTSSGEQSYTGTFSGAYGEIRGLVADTQSVFTALETAAQSPLVAQWRDLVDWSATMPSSIRRELVSEAENEGSEWQESGKSDTEEPGYHREGSEEPEHVDGASSVDRVASAGITGDGVRVKVGNLMGTVGNAPVDFWPSNTDLNQMNVGIVGDLGTGKTELVKALISQIREQAGKRQKHESVSMLIFDYKGDFQHESFVARVGGVVLNPHEIPVNVFMAVTGEYSRLPYQQAAAFVDVLKKIYKGVGPVQASILNESIRELYEVNDNLPPTLAEVRELYIAKSGNPDSVSAILDSFVLSRVFSDDRSMLRSFGDLLEGKVVIVALDRLGQDQSAKNALVALFLNLYYDNMLRSDKPGFQGADPQLRYLKSFLLVDEAVNIMRYDFQVLMDLMLQGRQFGYGVMLSSQYLSHFRSGKENYGQPLRTWFIHKVPSVSGKELASLGLRDLPPDVPARISELGQHEVLYKSLGYDTGRFARVIPYYELYDSN